MATSRGSSPRRTAATAARVAATVDADRPVIGSSSMRMAGGISGRMSRMRRSSVRRIIGGDATAPLSHSSHEWRTRALRRGTPDPAAPGSTSAALRVALCGRVPGADCLARAEARRTQPRRAPLRRPSESPSAAESSVPIVWHAPRHAGPSPRRVYFGRPSESPSAAGSPVLIVWHAPRHAGPSRAGLHFGGPQSRPLPGPGPRRLIAGTREDVGPNRLLHHVFGPAKCPCGRVLGG